MWLFSFPQFSRSNQIKIETWLYNYMLLMFISWICMLTKWDTTKAYVCGVCTDHNYRSWPEPISSRIEEKKTDPYY